MLFIGDFKEIVDIIRWFLKVCVLIRNFTYNQLNTLR